jgi:hypothetical protein
LPYAEALSKDKEGLRQDPVWPLSGVTCSCASGASAPLANLDRQEQAQDLAGRFGIKRAHAVICSLEQTLDLIDRNVNQRLAVEVLMLDLPYRS